MTQADISRRDFLKALARYGVVLGGAGLVLSSPAWLRYIVRHESRGLLAAGQLEELLRTAPLARYWVSTATADTSCLVCHDRAELPEGVKPAHRETIVRCLLCAQRCIIRVGERGRCHTRMNVKGELRSLVYGRPIAIHIDPIEKKPFYHFLPGSQAFSLATAGCPLSCKFCQNWDLSQARPEDHPTDYLSPERIVEGTLSHSAPIIAFTYNEPTVFTEYLTDIARVARKDKLRSVLVSCGFMNEAPLTEMCQVLDAIKIDLKGFSEDFYRKVCSAELKPVLRSIKQVSRSGRHLEIVNLVVPTLNDSDDMMRELARWVVGEVGPDVPVHFTRFHPDYQMLNLPPTPVATLERARDIALEQGMHYPFVGNVPGHPGNNSYCPACGRVVIGRSGFFISEMHLKNGCCAYCGAKIAGVWS